MSIAATENGHAAQGSERRRLRRNRVLLSGILADGHGHLALDCTIRDLHQEGAQIGLSENPSIQEDTSNREDLHLLRIRHHVADLTKVVWSGSGRMGLSFVQHYSLDDLLPPQLRFLRKLLVEAKLQQVKTLAMRGVSLEEAICTIGLTEDMYCSWCDEHGGDGRGMRRLREELGRLARSSSGFSTGIRH